MILVQIAKVQGSAPREAGAWMAVSRDATQGTIGGGALEYMAIDRARQMLARGEDKVEMEVPLGPAIGQCCGGRVALRLNRKAALPPGVTRPSVLIFGAGHTGRALAAALAPLPLAPLLIDSRPDELARAAPGIATRLTPLPEAEIRAAPPGSAVIILTHDHALDFLLAVQALARPDLPYVGMIGSATKRAQFARFARAHACDPACDPARLVCPIGVAGRPDKRPAVIAAFTATEIMARLNVSCLQKYPCDI